MGESRKFTISSIYSIVAAVWLIAFALGTYWAGPAAFVGTIGYLAYLGVIGLAIAAVLSRKKEGAGFIEFQPALRTAFVVFVVALGVQTLFIWILVHRIDPKFRESVAPLITARNEALDRWQGLSEDQIRTRSAAEAGKDPFPIGGMLGGLARYYIVCFLFSLAIAAAAKNTKPSPRPTGL